MKKSNPLLVLVSIILTLVIIASGLILPQLLLDRYAQNQSDVINKVSSANYIGDNSAIVAMASSQLTEYEKIQLITNSWEGESSMVSAEFSEKDAFSMYQKVKKGLHELYAAKLYPTSLRDAGGDNWYSWEAERYCCTDSTFHTFIAYYWVISLYKYDNTETHTVIISEDGTIIYAECIALPDITIADIATKYESLSIMRAVPHSYVALDANTHVPDYREIKTPDSCESVGVIVIGDDHIKTKNELDSVYSTQHSSISSYEYYYVFKAKENLSNWKTIKNAGKTKYIFGITPYSPANDTALD